MNSEKSHLLNLYKDHVRTNLIRITKMIFLVCILQPLPVRAASKIAKVDVQIEIRCNSNQDCYLSSPKKYNLSLFNILHFWKKKSKHQLRPNPGRTTARQLSRYQYLWEYIFVLFIGLVLEGLVFSWFIYLASTKSALTAIYVLLGAQVVVAIFVEIADPQCSSTTNISLKIKTLTPYALPAQKRNIDTGSNHDL